MTGDVIFALVLIALLMIGTAIGVLLPPRYSQPPEFEDRSHCEVVERPPFFDWRADDPDLAHPPPS